MLRFRVRGGPRGTRARRPTGHSARRAYPECLRRLPPVGRGRKQAVQEFGHRERVLAGFEKGAGGLRLHVPALPAPGADRLAPRVGLLPAKGERGVPWSAGGGEDPPGDQPGDPGDGKGPARVLPVVEGSRAGRFSRRKPGARVRGVGSDPHGRGGSGGGPRSAAPPLPPREDPRGQLPDAAARRLGAAAPAGSGEEDPRTRAGYPSRDAPVRRHARRARVPDRSAPSVRARRAHPGTHPPPPLRPQPLQIPSTHPSAGTQSPRKSGTFSTPGSGTFSTPFDTHSSHRLTSKPVIQSRKAKTNAVSKVSVLHTEFLTVLDRSRN